MENKEAPKGVSQEGTRPSNEGKEIPTGGKK